MKREDKFLLSIISLFALAVFLAVIISLNASTIAAQDEAPNILGINPENIENIPQTPEEFVNASKNYLRKEWGKILENNTYIGPIIKGYRKIAPYTDPIVKIVVGMPPSLSWLFFLTFFLWIALVTNLYRALSVFSTFSKGVSFIISLATIIIISVLGIPKFLADKIISLIGLLTSTAMQVAFVILVILTFILISMFSKEFEAAMKKWKENKEREKALVKAVLAEEEAKQAKERVKQFSKPFEEMEED